MARALKRFAERALVGLGVARSVERLRRPLTAILAYHNIVPRGERAAGDLSLHTDQEEFGRQLDALGERFRIISLQEVIEAAEPESAAVAITFDDAYLGTLTAGVEELESRSLPATVFVPPGLLGEPGFWWDLLSRPGTPLQPEIREHALGALRGRQAEILRWARDQGIAPVELPPHARPVTEEGVGELVRGTGLTVGNHTWSHPNLSALEDGAAATEVRRASEWIMESGLPTVDCLAYPYGLASAGAGGAASHAVLVDGGLARLRGKRRGFPAMIPRINVPRGLSTEGLALRLSGIVG